MKNMLVRLASIQKGASCLAQGATQSGKKRN